MIRAAIMFFIIAYVPDFPFKRKIILNLQLFLCKLRS